MQKAATFNYSREGWPTAIPATVLGRHIRTAARAHRSSLLTSPGLLCCVGERFGGVAA